MAFRIFTFDKNNEVILALLAALGFDSFEEKENSLIGYLDEELYDDHILAKVKHIAKQEKASFHVNKLEDKNWNETWESSFQPVVIDDFCVIKASFHPKELTGEFTIVIDPKMAFGTGHHETTYMMVKAMKNFNFDSKKVLDYGCGTGILAILAEMLGAQSIDAIDYDVNSYENTIDNCKINRCHYIKSHHGELADLEHGEYDIILANINRNVLLENRELLISKLSGQGSHLLLSGILISDQNIILEAYDHKGLVLQSLLQKGKWICLHYALSTDTKDLNS